MYLIYNGVNIECLEVEQFDYESVLDNSRTDYLYTRVRIVVTGLINGQSEVQPFTPTMTYDESDGKVGLFYYWSATGPSGAASSGSTPPANINPSYHANHSSFDGGFMLAGGGISAVSPFGVVVPNLVRTPVPVITTHKAVLHRLQAPRSRLFVFTGNGDPKRKDELLLMTPDWDRHTDCANGPIPILYSLSPVSGDAQSFQVRFAVETFINPMPVGYTDEDVDDPGHQTTTGQPGEAVSRKPDKNLANRALLSNRFKMRHMVDSDGYLTMQTQGETRFRTDLLYDIKTPLNPDELRLNLFLPVPFGMIRGDIEVESLPDGTGLTYSFVDRQQHSNFVAGPYAEATGIEAVHRQAVSIEGDLLSSALDMYERRLSIRAQREMAKDREPTKPPSGGKP